MMSNEAYRDDFKLSEHDIYLYVQGKGSNAVSLVAAFESTRDKDYLKAAELGSAPEQRRRDRISVYLDALETQF